MPDHDSDTAAPPDAFAGRYVIGRVIGRGGLSTVYAAHDTLLDREVAVKIFTARADDRDKLRLQEAEARLVARLNHYALTTLFDVGVDSSDPRRPQIYLIMESIPGADLKERLEEGTLSPLQVAYLGFDLAEGLQYVHENGFLHRDIKPANVLLASRGAETRLRGKLTDFGIASVIGERAQEELTVGTAAYISPEQVIGDGPSPASDVYSLGLVLLEALTGRLEYPGNVEQSAYGRLERDPAVPDSVPRPLAEVLRGLTQRDPQARLGLADAAERLQDFCLAEVARARGMRTAAAPVDEPKRIDAVHRYNILDTPPDESFDRLTRLASRLVGAPIAFVSIVDTDRVFHKSRLGFDVAEVPTGGSLCTVTVAEGRPWAVTDILTDPRTRDVLLPVERGFVRSYAAAPLVTNDGFSIGSICVYDHDTRDFTEQNLADLADLAAIAMRELEFRLASRRAAFGEN